ncbi:MAG: hypothetical protein QOJ91_198 [Sphingomonadales bacterium]|jgi:hypothetical protein|nr:hypothetical protein [Sphingomonadales bacterium]
MSNVIVGLLLVAFVIIISGSSLARKRRAERDRKRDE